MNCAPTPLNVAPMGQPQKLPLKSEARIVICHPYPACSSPSVAFTVSCWLPRIMVTETVSPGFLLARASPSDERSEEHTSELQSHSDLVCRLLLAKKKEAFVS